MTLTVRSERLLDELKALATFTEPAASAPALTGGIPDTAVTRVVFTERDREARAWLAQLAADAGLSVRTDAIGNTFYRWPGTNATLPAVATGSHIDAIPNAGMYDGTVGVLGGLEAVRALKNAGHRPRRSIELVLFTSEEPTRFGIGCLGSRMLSGALTPQAASTLRDSQGISLEQASRAAGFQGPLDRIRLKAGHYSAFVELHIEQGPLLEQQSLDIGIVTDIAAPAAGSITIQGFGGHAGALLMPARRDALTAAAEIILAAEHAALATGAPDTVATIGLCDVFPGASNSVPSRVRLSLDVRDIDLTRRDSVLTDLRQSCAQIAQTRNVEISFELLNTDPPAACDPAILDAIEKAAGTAGISYRTLVSRAYHDALFMARLCPIGMIFVPSRAGVSHRPDEYTAPHHLAQGVQILARTLATLST